VNPTLEATARRWWAGEAGAGGAALSAAAFPLELLFRAAVAARSGAYRARVLRTGRAPVPVISVGNLTVGGTGKTPVVGWLVRVLLEAGCRPAVAMRGHGRDERLLHARWSPGARVHADRDRVRAAREAAAAGADVVVLDDGFQHRRLVRELDLVLLAAEQPFPGPLLPRGPYREPAGALARADWVIVTRRVAPAADAERMEGTAREAAPRARIAHARLAPDGWQDLDGRPVDPPNGDALAVAGIAGPEAFAALVRAETRAPVELLAFPDHHEYAPSDLERIRRVAAGRSVAVTEKDAVKLSAHAGSLLDVRVLALSVEIEAGEDALRAAVLGAAARSAPVVEGRP
jgi:tetraacyldisaccharide 4'-kinase